MLPSGYLIRPCEGGGSIIRIVDHLNLQVWVLDTKLARIACDVCYLFSYTLTWLIFFKAMECARSAATTLRIINDGCSEIDNCSKYTISNSRRWILLQTLSDYCDYCREYSNWAIFLLRRPVLIQWLLWQALRYIRQVAQETSGEVVYSMGRQPAVLRTFSQRMSRYVTWHNMPPCKLFQPAVYKMNMLYW
jgi:hypothetical protein